MKVDNSIFFAQIWHKTIILRFLLMLLRTTDVRLNGIIPMCLKEHEHTLAGPDSNWCPSGPRTDTLVPGTNAWIGRLTDSTLEKFKV